MDSAPVECISVGSLVTVVNAKVAPKYGLKSRRVLVQYMSPFNGAVSEGWASVQSAQGYTILSPLIDLCYTNSRWGCTRPIIRQCGHAAHLGCVDAHVASIHQKSEQDTPFDGRFAAEIGDGEFLCPLCKQLSNIVVPVEENDKHNRKRVMSQVPFNDRISSRFDILKSVLTKNPGGSKLNEKKKIAIKQYGTYLYQAMEVSSWDKWGGRSSTARYQWQRNLKTWDYTEEGSDTKGDSVDTDNVSIGDILTLLRQQHIAWSAAGHGAAASEASTRGINTAGFEPATSDPWVDFNSDSRDAHPMVLELRRTLIAAASLFEIVSAEMVEQLSSESKSKLNTTSVIGCLLANIINGTFWTSIVNENENEWSTLTSLLSSIPCHVSRDMTLARRYEARATAAQIWAVKGGTYPKVLKDNADGFDIAKGETQRPTPSTPRCVRQIPDYQKKLRQPWGAMNPMEVMMAEPTIFRPAFASGFLYMPLLSWDLDTFAGALFSTLLTSNNLEAENICDVSRILLLARMIQVLVTPHGFEEAKENAMFECDINVGEQNQAISSLFEHLDASMNPGRKPVSQEKEDGGHLLSSISLAILPFARTLVLLLRATFSALRQRGSEINIEIESFVEDEDTMYIEDGFYFMQKLGCPLPSEIVSQAGANNDSMFWGDLINRWTDAVVSFDAYHGSEGGRLEFSAAKSKWVSVSSSPNSNKKQKSEKMPMEDIETKSSSGVMQLDDGFHGEKDAVVNNEDETMEDYSLEEDAVVRFQFDQVDSALDQGADFEDDEDIDDSTDVQDVFGLPSLPSQPSQDASLVHHNDEDSVYSSGDIDDDIPDDDDFYANISSAVIIPFQPNFLGNKKPGPGPRGCSFDYLTASTIMSDLSHLGTIHTSG